MPRRKIIDGSSGVYRDYSINTKYQYDGKQLDKVIDALEYYRDQSISDQTSDYVVFEITLNIDETTKSPLFNPMDFDDGCSDLSAFNPNSLKTILPADQFYYRWTREYKDDHGMGEHYHLMVIANHFPLRDMIKIQKALESLSGVKTSYISQRLLSEHDHRLMVHFHWLNRDGVDGIEDAVKRHCYRAKLDQKLEGMKRSFDGSRELRPLVPISKRNQRTFLQNRQQSFRDSAIGKQSSLSLGRITTTHETLAYEPF
jgi:hypothetical protein